MKKKIKQQEEEEELKKLNWKWRCLIHKVYVWCWLYELHLEYTYVYMRAVFNWWSWVELSWALLCIALASSRRLIWTVEELFWLLSAHCLTGCSSYIIIAVQSLFLFYSIILCTRLLQFCILPLSGKSSLVLLFGASADGFL